MGNPIVTLNGVHLAGTTDWEWTDVPGTAPTVKILEVSRATWELLGAAVNPVRYRVERDGRALVDRLVSVRDVHEPDESEHLALVEIVDLRWLWQRDWVRKSFNVRRATANRTVVADGGLPENFQFVDDLRYAPYSLQGGKSAWTARDVMREVMDYVGTNADVSELPATAVEVEDLELHDPGDAAVGIVLAYFPGFEVRCNRDGSGVEFYDRLGTADSDALVQRTAGKRHRASTVRRVDRSRSRPSRIRVLFRPVFELRLDYSEGSTVVTVQPDNKLQAVLRVTDQAGLSIGGATVAAGSYVRQEQAYAAWGAFGAQSRAVSHAVLRQTIMRTGPSSFVHEFSHTPNAALQNPLWVQRAAEAASSFRQTYQIQPQLYGQLASVRASRPQVVSRDTRTFAEAEVYCDWVRRLSWHGYAQRRAQPHNALGAVVKGYADSEQLEDCMRAPADVALVGEGGVLTITPRANPDGIYEQTRWGLPLTQSAGAYLVPGGDLGAANRNADDLYVRWDYLQFSSSFKLALLVSAEPGDLSTEVSVDPQEPGSGPVLTIAVDLYPALYAWRDEDREAILAHFTESSPGRRTVTGLDHLLLNDELLREIARAAALRAEEVFQDQHEGTIQVDGDPSAKPEGNVQLVRQSSRGTTEYLLGPITQPADLFRYLGGSARRAILNVLSEEKR